MDTIPTGELDHVLALQLVVAWAGERRGGPPWLGWWSTEVVDEYGVADLLRRLTPRTCSWAALDAVREMARRVDRRRWQRDADPDAIRTLFHLGFRIDELLDERLAHHKRSEVEPRQALAGHLPFDLDGPLDLDALTAYLSQGEHAKTATTPIGRQLRGPVPESLNELADSLAAALLPLGDAYPTPHYRVSS